MIEGVVDIHTHNPQAPAGSVISVEPGAVMEPGRMYSVGVHPWSTAACGAAELERLAADAARPEVVAIGETGLDALRGADLARQIEIFRVHQALSEKLGLPMVLHVVRRYAEIIALRREARPSQRWIIHGFRGGAILARQLLAKGFDLSVGERFNSEAVRAIPAGRLWVETDVSSLTAKEIARRVAEARDGL
jgi:TatD DNase family protein